MRRDVVHVFLLQARARPGNINFVATPMTSKKRAGFLAFALGILAFASAQQFASAADVPAAAPVSPDYRIGPGDSLHVFVFENEQLSVTVPVRPDGKISTPLVEDMVAVGKTPSQLARDIEAALSKYVKTPKVNVVCHGAQCLQPGQGDRPGEGSAGAALSRGYDRARRFARRQGLEPIRGRQSRAYRREWSTASNRKSRSSSTPWSTSGDLTQNLPLQPGDVLVVPETRF